MEMKVQVNRAVLIMLFFSLSFIIKGQSCLATYFDKELSKKREFFYYSDKSGDDTVKVFATNNYLTNDATLLQLSKGNSYIRYNEKGEVVLKVNVFSSNNYDHIEKWYFFDEFKKKLVEKYREIKYLKGQKDSYRLLPTETSYLEPIKEDSILSEGKKASKLLYNYFHLDVDTLTELSRASFKLHSNGLLVDGRREGVWQFYWFHNGEVGKTVKYQNGVAQRVECVFYPHLQISNSTTNSFLPERHVMKNNKKVIYNYHGEVIKKDKIKSISEKLPACQCDY